MPSNIKAYIIDCCLMSEEKPTTYLSLDELKKRSDKGYKKAGIGFNK